MHEASPDADGLIWWSRQDSDALAVMLFGDRVLSSDLIIDATLNAQPLALPPAELDVYEVANRAAIAITL